MNELSPARKLGLWQASHVGLTCAEERQLSGCWMECCCLKQYDKKSPNPVVIWCHGNCWGQHGGDEQSLSDQKTKNITCIEHGYSCTSEWTVFVYRECGSNCSSWPQPKNKYLHVPFCKSLNKMRTVFVTSDFFLCSTCIYADYLITQKCQWYNYRWESGLQNSIQYGLNQVNNKH